MKSNRRSIKQLIQRSLSAAGVMMLALLPVHAQDVQTAQSEMISPQVISQGTIKGYFFAPKKPGKIERQIFAIADISDPAYSLFTQRVAANRLNFHVYRASDSGLNHGVPSGFFGEINKIHLDAACIDDPNSPTGCSTDPNRLDRERGTVLSISFDSLAPGTFAGVNIEEPENYGANPRGKGYDLRGAAQIVFDVRSPSGIKVRFGVGGCTITNFMSLSPSQTEYTKISIPLNSLNCQPDLANVHILFTVATDGSNAPNGGTVLLSNIRFEPVPTSQQPALGLPLSTQTFGVVPRQISASGRVPIPLDQVLRNLATIYESALTAIALFERGTDQDLINARLIADALVYALSHDNQGNRLPTASDGSAGLHNGYESGDIALLNSQGPGAGQASDARLAGFSAGNQLCGPSGFCLLLDGATGGNNAFAILALAAAYRRFNDPRYLDAAKMIGRWIVNNLADATNTGYGGYYFGYPDGSNPKELLKSKSTENNAAIFAALTVLAAIDDQPNDWTARANASGDFVMEMFDPVTGCFRAGTVLAGTQPGPGISPDGPRRGNDMINTFDFLDANVFSILALAATPRYQNRIDWRRPVQYVLDKFAQLVTANGQTFRGFSIVTKPSAGPNGIAWEFTGKAVVAMRFIDSLYQETRFKGTADQYLNQIRQAQLMAPFNDGQGLVASTLQDGDRLLPIEQCLSTPFQCIPERIGLAATAWAIFAEQEISPLNASTIGATLAVSVSAASYSRSGLASEAIAAVFGVKLATATQVAMTIPLPTSLAGTQVTVKDSTNAKRFAPLFFVSSGQINYQIPPDTATGAATITVTSGNGSVSTGTAQIERVAPGLFTFNADGAGVVSAVARRFRNNQELASEAVAQLNEQNRWIPRPIDLGLETDLVILEMFGTGFRSHSDTPTAVTVKIGDTNAQVFYAGLAPGFVGLDQLDVAVPRSLIGRGEVDLTLTVEGKVANTVRVHIK